MGLVKDMHEEAVLFHAHFEEGSSTGYEQEYSKKLT